MAHSDRSRDRSTASTAGMEYTRRLRQLGGRRWKQLLNVQAPYRWNVQRLGLGRTLDIGCGIGSNLHHLGGTAVGVDHNPDSAAHARACGLRAYTVEEFFAPGTAEPGSFDSLLVAHVLEHMREEDGSASSPRRSSATAATLRTSGSSTSRHSTASPGRWDCELSVSTLSRYRARSAKHSSTTSSYTLPQASAVSTS